MSSSHAPGRAEQWATRLIFFVAGVGMATWAPLVPYAKERAGLEEGTLGLLLLCLGAGSIPAMPLAGALAARLGCRMMIFVTSLVMMLALPFLAVGTSFPVLAGALLVFGAGVGALDVVMNIQAVMVERASGRTMMSGFHGMFSLGGIVGAAGVTWLLGQRVSPLAATLCVVGVILLSLLLAGRNLLPYGSRSEGPAFAVPHGVVLFIGLLCFVVFLTEGALLDWSAVFLTTIHKMPKEQAGLGYAAFALTMTVGRLTGDWIVRRLGPVRIVTLGGLFAALGVGATLLPSWQTALVGYALVGVGCSNIVPVLFSAVGRQKTMAENVAVPAITTLGYAGILVGPAAIGFVAHGASLPVAFGMVALALLGVTVCGRFLRV